MATLYRSLLSTALSALLFASTSMMGQAVNKPANPDQSNPPTVAEAEQFIKDAEAKLNDLGVKAARAAWVQSNFITDDTQQIASEANEIVTGAATDLAKQPCATRSSSFLPSSRAKCCCSSSN